jgi:hypothetical protein
MFAGRNPNLRFLRTTVDLNIEKNLEWRKFNTDITDFRLLKLNSK